MKRFRLNTALLLILLGLFLGLCGFSITSTYCAWDQLTATATGTFTFPAETTP
ncbi:MULTISPECIES: hypothetical protein [Eubacterium]|uniref:Uncharacterized protein n=1 Tax=Eubacterium barkeri TaxID=1528 RepID=A0A1H3AJG9_EUBBA|nr:hypothetical protein [Eubacterium barkeri]SDX29304.1 hypothetical protein SAMN04488579_10151 [Eubacterium barkeri]